MLRLSDWAQRVKLCMTKQKKSFMEKLIGSKREDVSVEEPTTNSVSMNVSSDDKATDIDVPQTPQAEMSTQINDIPSTNEGDWSTSDEESGEGQLTIDVYQTDDDIIIKSTIAGVNPEDLDVSINNDMITIKGERKFEDEVSEDNFYYQECYWGSFSRSVVLPVDVVAEKIEASLKNGILTIKLPKADTNRTKKIKVRGF